MTWAFHENTELSWLKRFVWLWKTGAEGKSQNTECIPPRFTVSLYPTIHVCMLYFMKMWFANVQFWNKVEGELGMRWLTFSFSWWGIRSGETDLLSWCPLAVRGGHWARWKPLGCIHSRVPGCQSWFCSWLKLVSVHPGRQQVRGHMAESLPPMWETCIEFWVLGFGLIQPSCCEHLGKWTSG